MRGMCDIKIYTGVVASAVLFGLFMTTGPDPFATTKARAYRLSLNLGHALNSSATNSFDPRVTSCFQPRSRT